MTEKREWTPLERYKAKVAGFATPEEWEESKKQKKKRTLEAPERAKETVADFLLGQEEGDKVREQHKQAKEEIAKRKEPKLVGGEAERGAGPLSNKEYAEKYPAYDVTRTDLLQGKDDVEQAVEPPPTVQMPADKPPAATKSTVDQLLARLDKMVAATPIDPEDDKTIKDLIQAKKDELASTDKQETIESVIHGLTKIAAGLYGMKHGIGVPPLDLKPRDWEARRNRIERLFDSEVQARRGAIRDGNVAAAREAAERRGYAVRLWLSEMDSQARADAAAERAQDKATAAAEREAAKAATAAEKAAAKRVSEYDKATSIMVGKGEAELSATDRSRAVKHLQAAGMPLEMAQQAVQDKKSHWLFWEKTVPATGEKALETVSGFDPSDAVERGAAAAQPTPASGPAVGTIQHGYRFKGGDPAKASNWEKVQ
jgi:hypothetical protein